MTRCKDYGSDLCWFSCSRRSIGCGLRYWKGKKKEGTHAHTEKDDVK